MLSTSTQVFYQLFKKKDYNRVLPRLKNYQSQALFMANPPLSDIREVQRMHSNLKEIELNARQIGLSLDEMCEDWESLGLTVFSESLEALMETFRILHDALMRHTKHELSSNKLEHLKFHKRSLNSCQECSELHQATHLKRIKASFGMLYPQVEQGYTKVDSSQKQDLAVRQKEDFIDQLNCLLDKKSSINYLTVNARKYKDLVECLSKMDHMESKIKKTVSEGPPQETEDGIRNKYQEIIKEVQNILNSKLKDGYSTRIKTMLDKFEIVLKAEHSPAFKDNEEPHTSHQETQTTPTPEAAQLALLKDDLSNKDKELAGIREGRKKVEQKYIKLLESERRVSRQASSNMAKNEKLIRELQEREKQIEKLLRELGREKAERYRTFDLLALKIESEKPSRFNDKLSVEKKMSKEITMPTAEKKNCCIQTDLQQVPRISEATEAKKKNYRFMKKLSFIHNSSNLLGNTNSHSEAKLPNLYITRQVHVAVEPTSMRESSRKIAVSTPLQEILKGNSTPKNLKKVGKQGRKMKKLEKMEGGPSRKENQPSDRSYKEKGVSKMNKVNLSKSIEILQKDEMDEVIIEKSQHTVRDSRSVVSSERRSSKKVKAERQSREFKDISLIRMSEFKKEFRLNHIKTDTSKTKDQSYFATNRDNIVRIDKFEKKNSNTLDREKVKEIVSLLKMQKETFTKKPSALKPIEASSVPEGVQERGSKRETEMDMGGKQQERELQSREDVVQTVQTLKLIIESEYPYLKASGFINFLLTFEKKPALANRNMLKYNFQFTHLGEKDLEVFGGGEEMVRFVRSSGVWEKYMVDENDLKLYYKHMNFAHKVSKYFLLLKKMNQDYFEEYTSFIVDPLTFALTHFHTPSITAIKDAVSAEERERMQKEAMVSNEATWKKVMMRLIRFHHQVHKNCRHLTQFLDKIGYYRYSI